VLAYNLGNLWPRLLLPKKIEKCLLTSLQKWLGKAGGRRKLRLAETNMAPEGEKTKPGGSIEGDFVYTDRAPDAEIDASVLINLTELAGWLINPQISKPCCFMPSMKVTSKELDQMVHTYNR
jgi:hypothetical protein